MYSAWSAPLNSRTVFSALSVPRLYNASLLVASSVKRIRIKWHIAVHLLVGYSHRKFIVEEELEVGL
jgi:hypothetical protein